MQFERPVAIGNGRICKKKPPFFSLQKGYREKIFNFSNDLEFIPYKI